MQALLGRDDMLVDAICRAQKEVHGRFVALVGTPNPMVLGTDYKALAHEVEQRCSVPAISFNTSGTKFYDHGVEAAFVSIARDLLDHPSSTRKPRSVNLLGATPLDMTNQKNIDIICEQLRDAGWSVCGSWAMGSTLEELQEGLSASCNIVLTHSGLTVARWLKKTYGIPYVWGCFSGQQAVDVFLDHLNQVVLGRTEQPLSNPPHSSNDGGRALVIADQVLAEGYRRALEFDAGFSAVDVATFFAADFEGMRPHDTSELSEDVLERLLQDGNYDLVIGDGLLDTFVKNSSSKLLAIPHVAISSRISWNTTVCPYGSGFIDLLRSAYAKCDNS
jgi:hypothetical protein